MDWNRRIYRDPIMGFINPRGWTVRGLTLIYVSGIGGGIVLVVFLATL